MARVLNWLCAIAILFAVAVQSQAQDNAANEKTHKTAGSASKCFQFNRFGFIGPSKNLFNHVNSETK